MAHYSVRDGRWYGVRHERPSGPDPYGPDAPGAAARNRLTETILASGTVRVDVGEPVQMLPSEGLRSTPIKDERYCSPPATSDAEPGKELTTTAAPAANRQSVTPRVRRDPWGLNRDEA